MWKYISTAPHGGPTQVFFFIIIRSNDYFFFFSYFSLGEHNQVKLKSISTALSNAVIRLHSIDNSIIHILAINISTPISSIFDQNAITRTCKPHSISSQMMNNFDKSPWRYQSTTIFKKKSISWNYFNQLINWKLVLSIQWWIFFYTDCQSSKPFLNFSFIRIKMKHSLFEIAKIFFFFFFAHETIW